jgi:hypothetical protein
MCSFFFRVKRNIFWIWRWYLIYPCLQRHASNTS